MNKLDLKEANKAKLFKAIAGTNPNINSNEHTSNISLRKASKYGLLKEESEDPGSVMDGELMNTLQASLVYAMEFLIDAGIPNEDAVDYISERVKYILSVY